MNHHSNKVIEKHSLILRIVHWVNVPLLFIMIWSGILIYWADQAFIKIPDGLIETFSINHRLAEGMGWHFLVMWPFTINGFIYLLYLIVSGYKKNKKKYTSFQLFAYSSAIFMGAGSIVTGLAIYKPVQLGFLVELLGGYDTARKEHFCLMVGLIFFVVIHLIKVLTSGWNNFRSMIAGYEIEK